MITTRTLGIQNYLNVWDEMKQFTIQRNEKTNDELWLLEHYPVYTQGQAGKSEHILNPQSIPVVQSDRGGQVTYHGPGQLVIYTLMDLQRRQLGIRNFVSYLEQTLMKLLMNYHIQATLKCGAPGVYVLDKKIASIGLRVKNGCTYHGVALNVDMDLTPFDGINPCGYEKLKMTQIRDFMENISMEEVSQIFIREFFITLGHKH